MLILVINCGSSSLKYNLMDIENEDSLCSGTVERIGEESSQLEHRKGQEKFQEKVACPDHHKAIELVREAISKGKMGVLEDLSQVSGVGHRVVHGGEKYNQSVLIDNGVLESIQRFTELAPLHNPPALEGIKGCMKLFCDVPHVAVFDTAFHQSMQKQAFCYGLPYEYYDRYRIRKYGFHGTSHRYVAGKAAEILERPLNELNIITAHLGNGCSIAAVEKGLSVDTSMGFTPLEGLLMGTRSGDLDPAVVTFLMHREGLDPETMNRILNKKSGLLGVSGISNDMRDILKAMDDGNERAGLAYGLFVYRLKKYIGSYAAVLGTVDAVVFTAGIGENVPSIRRSIEKDLRPLLGEGTRFLTISTDEELLIAKDTYDIVSNYGEDR